MVEAATSFRKNSFNDNDSATLAKVATTFQNVSDEAISAGESADFIIAQMKAFNIEAGNAEHIIDAVNAVSNNYAVSSGQLAKNLGNMSAALAVGNNSFEESLGLLTAGVEVTRNASKVSRALVSVQSRLNQVIDDSSTTGQALTEWYQKHNIAILDQQGQLRSLYDVLTDVAKIWPTLTKNEQAYYLNQQAGANQSQNLAAILSNFDTAAKATETALNSAGSAMRENEAYQSSLEYQTNNLKATFQDFANNVLDKEVISAVLKTGNAFLELANSDIGQLVTKVGLLAGTGWGLSSLLNVSKLIPIIASQFSNLATVMGMIGNPAVVSSIGGIGTALSTVGGFASVALPVLLAVSAAIVGIVEAVKAYNDYVDSQKFENLVEDYENLKNEADEAANKIQEVNDKLRDLQNVPPNERGKEWQDESEQLKILLDYYEQLERARKAQAEEAGAAAYSADRVTGVTAGKFVQGKYGADVEDVGQYGSLQEAITSIAEATNTTLTSEQVEALSQITDETERAAKMYEYLRHNLELLGYTFSETTQTASEYEMAQGSAMQRFAAQIEETKKHSTELTQAQQEQYDAYVKNNQATYDYLMTLSSLTPEQQMFVDGYRAMLDAMGDYESTIESTNLAIEEAKNSFASYSEILTNYQNAMNGVTGASDAFVQSLFDQNGQLTTAAQAALTTDSAMASYANSIIQAQQEQSQANFNNLIEQIALVGQQATITAGQIANMMAMAGVQIGAGGSTELARNLQRTYEIKTGKKVSQDEAAYKQWLQDTAYTTGQNQWKRQQEEYKKQLESLKDYVPSGGGGGGGGSSAADKAKDDAVDAAKDASSTIKKIAIDTSDSALSSATSAIDQARQAAERAAEEAKRKILDSIQELKDASDDFWDSKTDAIEETNKELDRQKQLEEKLKALEEAKQKQILLYKNGQFQYDKDYGTIAKAQADYEETRDKIQREKELEQLKEMKDNATEIFNEMKDIVQNGGNVTQSMIDKWLKQMQADGANYYDSNKQLLSEWLDWAASALKEFGQGTIDAINNYISTSDLMSGGTYGSNASAGVATDTNGARYARDPMFTDENGDFVGFTTAFWIDRFDKQIKSGFEPEAWLGGGLGTNVFDDWNKVLNTWAKDLDPYALLDMLERAKAAQIVLKHYAPIFESLGYDDYAKLAEMAENMDLDKMTKTAYGKAAIEKGDDPFGNRFLNRKNSGEQAWGELWNLLYDAEQFAWLRDAEDDRKTIFKAITGAETISSGDLTGKKYDESTLKDLYAENDRIIAELSKKWFEAKSEEERKLLEMEAETRRKMRDEIEKELGMESSGKSEAEREANRQAGGTLEARQQQEKNAKNIDSIESVLEAVKKGQDISDEYINSAKDYLAKAMKENQEASDKLYSETEKAKLEAQTEQMQAISDALTNIQESGVSIKTTELLEGETTPWAEGGGDFEDWVREGEGETEEEERKRQQMKENAEAWWNASDEEKERLHKENEKLGEELGLTYDPSTGVWSKNATGTHNFRPSTEDLDWQFSYPGPMIPSFSPNKRPGNNIPDQGISLVGEKGPELRILNKGDNIMPSNRTANLWRWSSMTPQSILAALGARSSTTNKTDNTINIGAVTLPSVKDANDFVEDLDSWCLQYLYNKRQEGVWR